MKQCQKQFSVFISVFYFKLCYQVRRSFRWRLGCSSGATSVQSVSERGTESRRNRPRGLGRGAGAERGGQATTYGNNMSATTA